MRIVNRGFTGRRAQPGAGLVPPGQYVVDDFPVLTAGPTPDVDLDDWDFTIVDESGAQLARWTWPELVGLPAEDITVDIHCVTKWSKFDTAWKGVAFDTVAALAGVRPEATHVMWHSEHGFTANVPLGDVTGVDPDTGQPRAILAYEYGGEPLEPDHGYPLRSLVPRLYFWKSAKWLRGIEFMVGDRPGFWEQNGYHMYGDPFREQRYWGD